jgi:hypothetical protein
VFEIVMMVHRNLYLAYPRASYVRRAIRDLRRSYHTTLSINKQQNTSVSLIRSVSEGYAYTSSCSSIGLNS